MLNRIEQLQAGLVRAESYVLMVCLLAMLLLAGYNVVYRNVLVPLQVELREVRSAARASAAERPSGGPGADAGGTGVGGESSGFGGGFGGESSGSKEGDGSGDTFEGGFGEESSGSKEGDGSGDTFEGGFGEESSDSTGGSGDGSSAQDSFQGGFGGEGDGKATESKSAGDAEATADRSGESDERAGSGTPPVWAAAGIRTINTLKIGWVDPFLRHMVLVVGFLGGMIAVRRREHITIDAIGRSLSGRTYHVVAASTNLFASAVCGLLAWSGWRLVANSLNFPEQVLPGVQLWVVQSVFPSGFGLIGFHFLLRAIECGCCAHLDEPVERRDETPARAERRDADQDGAAEDES